MATRVCACENTAHQQVAPKDTDLAIGVLGVDHHHRTTEAFELARQVVIAPFMGFVENADHAALPPFQKAGEETLQLGTLGVTE